MVRIASLPSSPQVVVIFDQEDYVKQQSRACEAQKMTLPGLLGKLKKVFLYKITSNDSASTGKRRSRIRLTFSHRPIDEFRGPNDTYKVLRKGWSLFD